MGVIQNWIKSSVGGLNIRRFCESPSLCSDTHILMPCFEVSHSTSPLPWREHMTIGFVCVSADFIFQTTRQIYKNFSMGEGVGGLTASYAAIIFVCTDNC